MNKQTLVALMLVTGGIVSGCSSIGPERSTFGGGRVTTASANQMFGADFEEFSDKQLLYLLDPESTVNYTELDRPQRVKALQLAFREANTRADYGVAHRSQIQDRLIAASNQRCNLYMTYLKRVSVYTNGLFGSLTTILGGAGAIVTGEDTSRLLSGLAGITSGVRGEMNQAIFETIATSVINPSIQKTRDDLLAGILKKRKMPLAEYTVEGAIADVIRYHGACSMDAGIAYAEKSIMSFDDIGVKRFSELQQQLGIARSASEAFSLGPVSSALSAQKVLDVFAEKLAEYKSRIDPQDPKYQKVAGIIGGLETSVTKGGDLRVEAEALDEEMKTAVFEYASATGVEKTAAFDVLKVQQQSARNFSDKVDANHLLILAEMKKVEQ